MRALMYSDADRSAALAAPLIARLSVLLTRKMMMVFCLRAM